MPYLMIRFNDTLTNDIVSSEQLDPELQIRGVSTYYFSYFSTKGASNEYLQHMFFFFCFVFFFVFLKKKKEEIPKKRERK